MHVTNGWKRINGNWNALKTQRISANGGNAWRGSATDKHFIMECGGNTSGGSNGSYTIDIADKPEIEPLQTLKCDVVYKENSLNVDWEIDESTAPQFSYSIKIFDNKNCTGDPLFSEIQDGEPDIRTATINAPGLDIVNKVYFAQIIFTDVIDQKTEIVKPFGNTTNVIGQSKINLLNEIKLKYCGNGSVKISLSAEINSPVNLIVFNSSGKKVYQSEKNYSTDNERTITWNKTDSKGNK